MVEAVLRFIREAVACAALALQAGVVWFYRSRLHSQVPAHYGITGAPDEYGDKSTLIVIFSVTILLYGLLTVLSFFPRGFNYPVAVTDGNRDKLQAMAVALLGWIKAEIVLLFLYITWTDVQVCRGVSSGLGWAFLSGDASRLRGHDCRRGSSHAPRRLASRRGNFQPASNP